MNEIPNQGSLDYQIHHFTDSHLVRSIVREGLKPKPRVRSLLVDNLIDTLSPYPFTRSDCVFAFLVRDGKPSWYDSLPVIFEVMIDPTLAFIADKDDYNIALANERFGDYNEVIKRIKEYWRKTIPLTDYLNLLQTNDQRLQEYGCCELLIPGGAPNVRLLSIGDL